MIRTVEVNKAKIRHLFTEIICQDILVRNLYMCIAVHKCSDQNNVFFVVVVVLVYTFGDKCMWVCACVNNQKGSNTKIKQSP